MQYFETSAKTSENINEVFTRMTEMCIENNILRQKIKDE